jgi:hypothetical protein
MFLIRNFFLYPSRIFLAFTFSVASIASCTVPAITTPFIPDSTVASTSSPQATFTPTPITEKVFLLDSEQVSQTISQPISSTLFELTQSQGWELISSKERPIQEFEAGIRIVVVLPPDPGLETISAEYPEIQFLAIGISGLQPSPNLNVIGAGGLAEDRIAFIAGYISAVLTKDWRVGIIAQSSSAWIEPIQQSFTNGVVYYCGICQLTYPPYYDYPILSGLSQEASDDEWQSAMDLLSSYAVKTVFIYSEQYTSSTLEFLSQNHFNLLGITSPPIELENNWIATIRAAPERIIQDHWEDLVSQEGGWAAEIPIILENVNESSFSPGKQQWVQEVVDDVIDGYIGTGWETEDSSQ